MNDEALPPAVTTLNADGTPAVPAARSSGPRAGFIGGVIALIVLAAVGSVLAWRLVMGSPYSAAEAVPSDADIVLTIDFAQLRDLERVDRFIQAFAAPMARHGIIDDVPDLENAMREIDDVAEEELGFRFAEESLAWIGRSAAVAIWVPDDLLDPAAAVELDAPPPLLVTVDIRDGDAASAFLDRMLAEAVSAGGNVVDLAIDGTAAHEVVFDDGALTLVAAIDGDRFVVADTVATMRRSLSVEDGNSVAQVDDFQELAGALGDGPLMTWYLSDGLGERMATTYRNLGVAAVEADAAFRAAMAGVVLDDHGVLLRSATFVDQDATAAGPGDWSRDLPGETYAFLSLLVPERFLSDAADALLETVAGAEPGAGAQTELIASVDDLLGVSLLDELLPQFGRELLLAVMPTTESQEVPGVLLGIGLADPTPVETALRHLTGSLQGEIEIRVEDGTTIFELDPSFSLAASVTEDALFVSLGSTALNRFEAGADGVTESESYRRTDTQTIGDGLVLYAHVGGLVADFADDPVVADILRPLEAVGVGAEVQGDIEISEMRVLVDY